MRNLRPLVIALCLAWLVAPACSPPGGDSDADTDVDGDTDVDADSDGDGDADSDSDADLDHDEDVADMDGTGDYDIDDPDGDCSDSCEEASPDCLSDEVCGNGSDDDCNGAVDEDCPCEPGAVQACFLGPPGYRGRGVCTDGHQTCEGMEFGAWGDCIGGIWPSEEVCDLADNDCDACADDDLCCGGELDCPEPGDPRVPETAPFNDYTLHGGDFFSGDASAWSWEVHGPPCDLMRERTGSAARSYTLTGADTADPTMSFTLSGDYTVIMRVTTAAGETLECTFIVHVRGPGLRVELCWDRVGTFRTDLDLHLHRPGNTTDWFGTGGTEYTVSNDDCYYCNCKSTLFCTEADGPPDWGYDDTALANCENGPGGAGWRTYGACRNPRLDIDNYTPMDGAKPENINLDNPRDDETFRVMVHYYSGTLETHPIVNVYCGGYLVATYGDVPDELDGFDGSATGGWGAGWMWRVVDVTTNVDGAAVTCDLDPLRDPDDAAAYWVTEDDMTY